MNIAIFTDSFYPQINGVVTSLVAQALQLAKRGHRIVIFAPRNKKNKSIRLHRNIESIYLKSIKANFYEDFRTTFPLDLKVLSYFNRKKIDIVHFMTPFTIGMNAILASKIFRKPLVGTFHTFISDPKYLEIVRLHRLSKILTPLTWAYSNMYYNSCSLVISPSEATRQELIKNKCRAPIQVISNGIDLKKFINKPSKNLAKYRINSKTLLFVGRVSVEKSIDVIISSLAMVIKKHPDARLLIVGAGPAKEELEKITREKKLAKNVIFAGKIEHDTLVKSGILHHSAIFVTASKTENQPMTILEACACGLPVVGVNSLGVPEMVSSQNGIIVEPDNPKKFAGAIIRILDNPKLRKQMSENSLKFARKNSIEKVGQQLENAYKILLENSKKSS